MCLRFLLAYISVMKLPSNHKIFTIIIIIATPLVGTVSAYGSATTTLTMTVTSSIAPTPGLSISAPSSLSLGSDVSFPATFAIPFTSDVIVTDSRGTAAGWTSQVLISPLTPPTGPAIPASIFSYDPGTPISTGSGTLVPTIAAAPGTASTVVVASSTTGMSGRWRPTLTITEPNAPATGSYSGTVTSSVY